MPPLPAAARPAALAQLRERLRFSERTPDSGRLFTGLPDLDGWLGGWPAPGVTEIVGAPGTGRLGLLIPALAELTRRGRSVMVVDAMEQVYPPGWIGSGPGLPAPVARSAPAALLDPERFWLVRPGLDRAAWVAEQASGAGALSAVVLLDAPRVGRASVRLARAAERGGTALFVVSEESEAELPAALRLQVRGFPSAGVSGPGEGEVPREVPGEVLVECTRSRDGRCLGTRRVSTGVSPGGAPGVQAPGVQAPGVQAPGVRHR